MEFAMSFKKPRPPFLAGLLLTLALAGSSWTSQNDATSKPSQTQCNIEQEPQIPVATNKHGTSIDWIDDPSEAMKIAAKEGKFLLMLHISGHFNDPELT
jgi:hypothetical protein